MPETASSPPPVSRPTALAALAVLSLTATVVLGTRAVQVWLDGVHTIDQAVELTIETGAAACAAWLAVGAVVGLACAVVGRAGRTWGSGQAFLARCAPGFVRRMAGVAVAASVGIGLASPGALAAPVPGGPGSDDPPPPGVVLDLGWRPSFGSAPAEQVGRDRSGSPQVLAGAVAGDTVRSAARSTGGADRHASGTGRGPAEVVVSRGDTLWSLAAAHLARNLDGERSDPTPARVAAEVTAWHAANQAEIGPDPDLIRPGTVLRVPTERTEGAQP